MEQKLSLPRSMEIRLKLIGKVDPAARDRAVALIERDVASRETLDWDHLLTSTQIILTAVRLAETIRSEHEIYTPVLFVKFDELLHCRVGYEAWLMQMKRQIATDFDVLFSNYKQLTYRDDFKRLVVDDWYKFFSEYKADRLKGCLQQIQSRIAQFCGTEFNDWLSARLDRKASEAFNEMLDNASLDDKDLEDYGLSDPYLFESYCCDLLTEVGWDAQVCGRTGDQGVDVIAEKDGLKVAVQCKLYQSNVSNAAVQQVSAGATYHGCDRAVVVTNAGFTKSARQLANSLGVTLTSPGRLADDVEALQ